MRNLRSLIGTFISIGLLVALAVSPAFAQPRLDPPGLDRAIEAQELHTDALLDIQGVVGTAVGLGPDGGSVIKIYTERSGIGGIPRSLDGVPVVVQVTGRIFALNPPPHDHPTGGDDGEAADLISRFGRPVPIGVSTGHPAITAGTIGARVTDGSNVYALSNNHVYANTNAANLGDYVLQPGTFDGGALPDDAIGTLAAFVPILFNGSDNRVDAAIALDSTGSVGNATPSDGYGIPKSTTVPATINEKVQKYGRTTGLTKGRVTSINATVNVCYDINCDNLARFVGQIVVEGTGKSPFSMGGDSGSLIVSNDKENKRKPVGLLFAGANFLNADFTIANPIDEVLDAFIVTIDGE